MRERDLNLGSGEMGEKRLVGIRVAVAAMKTVAVTVMKTALVTAMEAVIEAVIRI